MTDKIKNLCLRTATGIAFVAVLVGGILWSNVTFTLLFAVITGLSVWEFCQVVNRRADVQTNAVICTVAGIYLFLAVSGFCSNLTPSGVFIPYLLSVVYLLVSELYLKSEHALNNWAYTMMSQMYVALPFASLNILTYQPEASYSIGVAYAGMLPLSVFRIPLGQRLRSLLFRFAFRSSQTVPAHLSEQVVGGFRRRRIVSRSRFTDFCLLRTVARQMGMVGTGTHSSNIRYVGRPCGKPSETAVANQRQRQYPAGTWRDARPFRQFVAGHSGFCHLPLHPYLIIIRRKRQPGHDGHT